MLEAPKKEKEKVRKSSATAEEAEMESRFHEVHRAAGDTQGRRPRPYGWAMVLACMK